MSDSNELFRWFVDIIIQQVEIQVVQLWTCRADASELTVRAFAYRDASLARNVFLSAPVTAMIEHIVEQRADIAPQAVQAIFSTHFANLLRRHSLNYAAGYGVREELCLPVKDTLRATELVPTPQRMVLLLFLSAPLQISFSEICTLLQQALMMAERCHLLYVPQALPATEEPPPGAAFTHLEAYIPCRTADVSSNPLALTIAIADKNARSLYAAIDDQKTVAELAATTRLTLEEICKALQFLLAQKRIQVYESGGRGRLANTTLFTRQGG